MLLLAFALAAATLTLSACGSDEKTVVVTPPQQPSTVVTPPANTVVVPQGSSTRVCPAATVC
jgi:hypothetical protein